MHQLYEGLTSGHYGQHHVNCHILLFWFEVGLLVFEHLRGCLLMQEVKNLMIKTIANEIGVLNGSITNFVIATLTLGLKLSVKCKGP
jgi:UDP-3-O-acyl-N-acetylglucosamine deacetylase